MSVDQRSLHSQNHLRHPTTTSPHKVPTSKIKNRLLINRQSLSPHHRLPHQFILCSLCLSAPLRQNRMSLPLRNACAGQFPILSFQFPVFSKSPALSLFGQFKIIPPSFFASLLASLCGHSSLIFSPLSPFSANLPQIINTPPVTVTNTPRLLSPLAVV